MKTPERRTETQSGPKALTLGMAELRQVCLLMPQGSSAPLCATCTPWLPRACRPRCPMLSPSLILSPVWHPPPSANHTVFQDPRAAGF